MTDWRAWVLAGAAACAPATWTIAQQGQPEQPAAVRPAGLDALDDDVLIAELVNRQLTPLLDRYLEQRNFPADQRQAIRAVLAGIRTLNAPTPPPESARREAVAAINANIDSTVAALRDPRFFEQLANVLIRTGVERDANILEYWGPSAALQVSLRPTVQTVLKALDKAAAEASKERDRIAEQIAPGNQDALAPRYTMYDNLATRAEYTRQMATYYLALTYDPLAPERQEIAQKAIEYLEQFDSPDTQVQPAVRLRIGQLHLVHGNFAEARKQLATVADNPGDEIKPPPDVSQRFTARYFATVADIGDNHLDDAERKLATLREWIAATLPADGAARKGAESAVSVLEYRLLMARAEAATDAPGKQQFRDTARALLARMVAERPELQSVIYGQVLATLPADVPVESVDPVVLGAMLREGDRERLKPPEERINEPVLERAIAAAREIVRRRGQPGVTDELVESAMLLEGTMLDRLERRPEAAAALIEYLKAGPKNPQNGQYALQMALAIVEQLRKVNRYDEATQALYDRILPIAIGQPYERRELAYDYARSLQRQGRYLDAVTYFRQVPKDDKRLTSARFYELLALKQTLDADRGTLTGALRGQMVADIRRLADEVSSAAGAAAKDATLPADQRTGYQTLVARSVLAAADTALRHEASARRAIQLLDGFEDRFKDVPGQAQRVADALLLRVNAHMDLGQTTEATAALVALLSQDTGGQGQNIIYTLSQRLDAEFFAARQAGNAERARALARSRAALSGYLVEWAAKSPNPEIRKYTYRYRVFDAGTHHLAAELETDPAARKAALAASMKRYQALLTPESHTEYVATLPPDAPDRTSEDPAVLLGLASVHFDSGDYASAQPILARLLDGRRLGPAMLPGDDGPTVNDAYWQATYQLLRSNHELAKAGNSAAGLDATKAHLKRLFVQFGRNLGGPRWASRFEELRQALTPEFDPPA